MASSKPPEELYDIQADPYELDNLADNPAYAADMVRLRQALDEWEASFPDLGMLPEEELLLSWRPNGEFEITEVPLVKSEGGRLEASCPTEGASIGWTTEPPTDAPPKSTGLWNLNDEPPTGGRHWQFYNGPFSPPQAETIWFRAHRLGFLQSADVAVKLG